MKNHATSLAEQGNCPEIHAGLCDHDRYILARSTMVLGMVLYFPRWYSALFDNSQSRTKIGTGRNLHSNSAPFPVDIENYTSITRTRTRLSPRIVGWEELFEHHADTVKRNLYTFHAIVSVSWACFFLRHGVYPLLFISVLLPRVLHVCVRYSFSVARFLLLSETNSSLPWNQPVFLSTGMQQITVRNGCWWRGNIFLLSNALIRYYVTLFVWGVLSLRGSSFFLAESNMIFSTYELHLCWNIFRIFLIK